MPSFKKIQARAAKRKGGEAILNSLLPKVKPARSLAKIGDDRYLSEMTRRIFAAGFVWSVIDNKWDGFEAAFLEFEPARLVFQPDDYWTGLTRDTRIVRNPQKIRAVRENADFIGRVAKQHGSFGKFLADWPLDDQVGLLQYLAKHGSRLGGNTGQYFLRFVGRDGFILSRDVVLCLRDAGLEIAEQPSSKKDLAAAQAQFNAWAKETGLPYTHLSRICSMSIGENYSPDTLREMRGE